MAVDLTNIENSVKVSNDEIMKIVTKLDEIGTHISDGKAIKKLDPSAAATLIKNFTRVNPRIQAFHTNINDVNRGLRSLSNTLSKFNANISGNASTKPSTANRKGAKSGFDYSGSFDSIKNTLDGIKTEIERFHQDFVKGVGALGMGTGNVAVDKKIKENKELEIAHKADVKNAELILMGLKTSSRKEKREAKRTLREDQRNKEKVARVRKGGGGGFVSNIVNGAVNGVTSFATGNISASGMLGGVGNMLGKIGGPWGMAIQGGFQLAKAFADIVDKEQKFGRDYARSYGGGRAGMNDFIRQSANFRLAMPSKYGFTNEEYFKAAQGLTDATGRAVYRRSNEDMKSAIGLSRMGIEGDTLGIFDTFGRGIQSTDAYFNKLYGRAGKSGLSFKKMTDAIKNNLKLAQTYTFSKGIDGLQKMAETSTRLKYNMSEAAKFAEQVNTVEGATKTAANLSVLGGEFSQFSNPMGMLYESLNDFEGLNERMVKLFSNMAFWNNEKGQIDMRAFDRMRIREASKAMGVDANEMMNIAMNSRREKMIEGQLRSLNVNEETAGYIKNLAQINKSGQAYISDTNGILGKAGEEILLSDPRFQKLIPNLKSESERKSNRENGSIGDVFVQTMTIYDFMEQNLKGLSGKVQALVARFVTKPPMTSSQDAYFDYLKKNDTSKFNELKDKYGGKEKFKDALKRGELDEEIEKFVGGATNRQYIDSKAWAEQGYKSNNEIFEKAHNAKDTISEARNWEKGKINDTQHHTGLSISENEHSATILKGESVLNAGATGRLGVNNIKALNYGADPFTNKVSNINNKMDAMLNSMKVAPAQVSSAPSKISFEPLTVNIGGKFDLSSNGRNQTINFDEIDTRALKKVILDAVTENIPAIMRKAGVLTNKGYDKEHDPYRGTFSPGF